MKRQILKQKSKKIKLESPKTKIQIPNLPSPLCHRKFPYRGVREHCLAAASTYLTVKAYSCPFAPQQPTINGQLAAAMS